jgi:hypothetical protein
MKLNSKISRLQFIHLAALGFIAILPCWASATETGQPSIIGKWIGKAENGDTVTYLFESDNTVVWSVDSEEFPGSVSARYVIDNRTEPAHLDIFEFDLPPLKDFIFLGILAFDGPTRFKLLGTPQKVGSDAKRPNELSVEAVVFTKVE